ncbi:MAG: histidine kinase, partial [Bacteroidales bacterium]|nr:histidine kinase [Bacteroidales bacterium]
MWKRLICFMILSTSLANAYAQAFQDIEWYDVDSLLSVLPHQHGVERLKSLNNLAASLSFQDAKQCSRYALEALELAKVLNHPEGTAAAFRNLGRKDFYAGYYPGALDYYQKALRIYDKTGKDRLTARTIVDISTTHFFAGNIEKALEIMDEALRIYRKKNKDGSPVGSARDTITIYSRIGLPYRLTGRSDQARLLYLKYLEVGKKNNFEITDMMVHHGLLAMCYYETGNIDSCIYYFRLSQQFPDANMSIYALKHENLRRMAGIYLDPVIKQRLHPSFMDYKNPNKGSEPDYSMTDTAIHYLKTSFNWFSQQGFLKQSQLASRQLGDLYSNLDSLKQAEHYYCKSEELLNEMISKGSYYRYDSLKYVVSWGSELYLPFTRKMIRESVYRQANMLYNQIYRFYQHQNRLEDAMKYLIFASNAKDTLQLLEKNREAIEIQTKYETEQKEQEIFQLSQENQLKELRIRQGIIILLALVGLLMLIILVSILLLRQRNLRTEQEQLRLMQRILRLQMNPHFIFNSLSSIQHQVVQGDSENASIYLAQFSILIRNVLHNSIYEYIELEEELKTLESYLSLQQLRFNKKFDFKIETDKKILRKGTEIPVMMLQPFVENAIEHGVKNKTGKGLIILRVKMDKEHLLFEIEDNGTGREKAAELLRLQNPDHQSMATGAIKERISIMNRNN